MDDIVELPLQRVPCVIDVRTHPATRLVGVAAADRIEDLGVTSGRDRRPVRGHAARDCGSG